MSEEMIEMIDIVCDVELDFTDEEFLQIAIMAHERDITINQLINLAIQEFVDNAEEKEDGTSND